MTEKAMGPSGPGTVVMDLGGDIGALILYAPDDLDGREIEISRDDEPGGHGSARSGELRVAARNARRPAPGFRGRLPSI